MTDPLFDPGDGNTLIDDDEADGLRLSWVRTRQDLNDAERDNILSARRSIHNATVDDVLDDVWLRDLHRRMFSRVWACAGKYRTTEKPIGIDPTSIAGAVGTLTDHCRSWIDHQMVEFVLARFHHRLVAIHPFPNGNGRHARAATEYLAAALEVARPTWGVYSGLDGPALRRRYVDALRRMDQDPDAIDALTVFTRS